MGHAPVTLPGLAVRELRRGFQLQEKRCLSVIAGDVKQPIWIDDLVEIGVEGAGPIEQRLMHCEMPHDARSKSFP